MNESFANFGEVLWAAHAHGADAGAAHAYRSLRTYLRNPSNYTKPLVLAATLPGAATSIGAYPNPCREQLMLSGLPAASVAAQMCSALGQLVLRQVLSAAQPVLATAGLAPGVYVVQLLGPAGQEVGQVRFARE